MLITGTRTVNTMGESALTAALQDAVSLEGQGRFLESEDIKLPLSTRGQRSLWTAQGILLLPGRAAPLWEQKPWEPQAGGNTSGAVWWVASGWVRTSVQSQRDSWAAVPGQPPNFPGLYLQEPHQGLMVKSQGESPGASGRGKRKLFKIHPAHSLS